MAEGATARRHHWPSDGCCANCRTQLMGNWCHSCGQRAEDHHHSLRHLATETIESFTHADGRLWRTLSLLVIRPARLTNDYLAGKRASEIPPLRLFFVTLLLVFATGAFSTHGLTWKIDPKNLAEIHQGIATGTFVGPPSSVVPWLRVHLLRAVDNPQELLEHMREWGERFAFLLAPLSALVLRLLFPFRRDMKLFDHAVFALHSLSYAGIVWVACMLWRLLPWGTGWVIAILALSLPVHLYRHMRGVYHTGKISTLLRMGLLFVLTLGIFVLLLAGLAVVSLGTLDA